jgi:hypothetical protein
MDGLSWLYTTGDCRRSQAGDGMGLSRRGFADAYVVVCVRGQMNLLLYYKILRGVAGPFQKVPGFVMPLLLLAYMVLRCLKTWSRRKETFAILWQIVKAPFGKVRHMRGKGQSGHAAMRLRYHQAREDVCELSRHSSVAIAHPKSPPPLRHRWSSRTSSSPTRSRPSTKSPPWPRWGSAACSARSTTTAMASSR